ncbi:DNA cytosine methyltransferase [Kitasatospora sp. NPDC048365]|uniref:DNA cytosine methyltransferase n=1 Tax=Kitasatospora sp. NPDC048365 TaxID=3364050 RepID=UPI0037232DA6
MHSPASDAAHEIVDLFAGPGGLDMAAQALLIPVTGVEWDGDANATRKAAGLATQEGDVREYCPERFSSATILAGGPPCQTFTVAGSGSGRRALDQVITFARRMAKGDDVRAELAEQDDPRTGLVLEPLRWALQAIRSGDPYQAIVLEQVPAVLPVWEEYKRILEELNYSAKCAVLHTEEFGVPQTRRRAILIARRLSDEGTALHRQVELPTPTHHRFHKGAPRPGSSNGRDPWVAMGEVVDLGWPFKVVSNYGTGGDPKARGVRSSGEPAFTVTGKISRNRVVRSDLVSPRPEDFTRFLDHQAGQLQTFPANYPWSGKAVAQQIGNAIPPRLGVHVLAAALDFGSEEIEAALKRLANWESPRPSDGTQSAQG